MALIDQAAAAGLIPTKLAGEIIQEATKQSASLKLFRRRTMTAKNEDQPVVAALPTATFVNSDTGHAVPSTAEWKNVRLKSEVVKAAVVVPKTVVADSDYPMWDELKPLIAEAIAIALDKAIFTGAGAPSTWAATGIVGSAIAAGNTGFRGVATKANGGLYKDLSDVMFKVIKDGYRAGGFCASELFEQYLLTSFDANGRPLADLNTMQKTLLGRPLEYTSSVVWPQTGDSDAEIIVGDFSKGIIGVRQDLEYTFVTEGVVSDPTTGEIIYNLPQQGLVELIVDARFAFVLAKPATRETAGGAEADRCPFGVLRSPDV